MTEFVELTRGEKSTATAGDSRIAYEKSRLEVAFANISEGIIILSADGVVEQVNTSAKKLLGLDFEDGLDAVTAVMDGIGLRKLMNDEKNSARPFRVNGQAGRTLQVRWAEMVDKRISDIEPGYVVVIRDVTEEIAAEKTKTEFVAAISHELRTPITSIQNSVSNMLAGVTGRITKKMHSYLQTMKRDCHRYADLINDLLDITALQGGSMPINRRMSYMTDVAAKAMQRLCGEARIRNIEIILEPNSKVPPVYIDPERICQVLRNLINNAVKYTSQGGKVTIRFYDKGDCFITEVEDTGAGISAELQERIFSKFYQIDRQAGPGYKGSGLGLAICSGIVSLHNGEIWVKSTQGQGSIFYFSLPKTDGSLVIARHLKNLTRQEGTEGQSFAVLGLKFDVSNEDKTEVNEIIAALNSEILEQTSRFLTEKGDLAVEIGNFEMVFVVVGPEKKRIMVLKEKICKIISNWQSNNCGRALILPMFGVALYPDDSSDANELQEKARRKYTGIDLKQN